MNAVAALAKHISVVHTSSKAAHPKLRSRPPCGGGIACWKLGSTSVCCAYWRLHERRAGVRDGVGSRTRTLEAKALIAVHGPETSPPRCDLQLNPHSSLAAAVRIRACWNCRSIRDAAPKAPLLQDCRLGFGNSIHLSIVHHKLSTSRTSSNRAREPRRRYSSSRSQWPGMVRAQYQLRHCHARRSCPPGAAFVETSCCK